MPGFDPLAIGRFCRAAVLLFALGPGLSGAAFAADRLTVLLDWFVNPDHGPIVIARERGYFAAEGLEVDVIAPADPSDPPKLVAAGRADLAVSYQPQLHLQVHEGLPLVRVGTLVATPLNCLLVRADGPVKALTDLAGRKVGFSVPGVEEAVLGAMLASAGLSMNDVERINVNWSLSPALLTGRVDAVIGAFRNFELNQMALEGAEGRCFYPEAHGMPTYDELIYVAHHERMPTDRIRRFLRATERAVQDIVNDPQGTWQVFKGTSRELDDELNRRAWLDTVARFALRPAAVDAGRYRRLERFLHEAGLTPGGLPLERLARDLGAGDE